MLWKVDHLLLHGGGIGITGWLSWLSVHTNVVVLWSFKASDQTLVDEILPALGSVMNKQISVGRRSDVRGILQKEVDTGYNRVGVVVCGHAEMCDEARAVVTGLERGSTTVFELHVDTFS